MAENYLNCMAHLLTHYCVAVVISKDTMCRDITKLKSVSELCVFLADLFQLKDHQSVIKCLAMNRDCGICD